MTNPVITLFVVAGLTLSVPAAAQPCAPSQLRASIHEGLITIVWGGCHFDSYDVRIGLTAARTDAILGPFPFSQLHATFAIPADPQIRQVYARVRGYVPGHYADSPAIVIPMPPCEGVPAGLAALYATYDPPARVAKVHWRAGTSGCPPTLYYYDLARRLDEPGGIHGSTQETSYVLALGLDESREMQITPSNTRGQGPPRTMALVNPCAFALSPPSGFHAAVLQRTVLLAWRDDARPCPPSRGMRFSVSASADEEPYAFLDVVAVNQFAVAAPSGIYFVRAARVNAAGVGDYSPMVRIDVP